MSPETLSAPVASSVSDPTVGPVGPLQRYISVLSQLARPESRWERGAYLALVSLLLLWAVKLYSTWATWGSLSIDCGREMYVPAILAQGKMLYRDVWFGYFPAAPYLNAFLFRLFGLRLEVLYWAGSLAALGCAVLIFLAGKRVSSSLAGWTAGAVVLLQSFHAWHFCFPLPYSFSSVYGCLASCLFLYCAVNAAASTNGYWMFAAGSAAAAAFLCKLEFGAACYVTLLGMMVARAIMRGSWRSIGSDLVMAAPGIVACGAVLGWMVSIGGAAFITEENLASTVPWSYFMRTYGKVWLAKAGLDISVATLSTALVRGLFFVAIMALAYRLWTLKRLDKKSLPASGALLLAMVAYFVFGLHGKVSSLFGAIFFPQDMVLYAALTAMVVIWIFVCKPEWRRPLFPLAILLVFAALLGFRILLRSTPGGYSIYYNGPAILCFLLLVRPMIPQGGPDPRDALRGEALISLSCLAVVALYSLQYSAEPTDLAPLITQRGTIQVPRQVAENYRAAIDFVQAKSRKGEMVLSVPEDTSVYFLSGTECPTRLFFFTPGMLVPGKMTEEVIQELEGKPVEYLLWSNRTFPDYGAPVFGTDFDVQLGSYLTSRYRLIGPLVAHSDIGWQTKFTVWERKQPAH